MRHETTFDLDTPNSLHTLNRSENKDFLPWVLYIHFLRTKQSRLGVHIYKILYQSNKITVSCMFVSRVKRIIAYKNNFSFTFKTMLC